jgi:hypothetical protein
MVAAVDRSLDTHLVALFEEYLIILAKRDTEDD